jgi:hypothetical protein
MSEPDDLVAEILQGLVEQVSNLTRRVEALEAQRQGREEYYRRLARAELIRREAERNRARTGVLGAGH